MHRKYNHAKKIISELKRHEQFLAHQLQERDQEYNSHLRLLKDRVIQLEQELATTQKFAGMPVKLPLNSTSTPVKSGSDDLSPPELLKQPPIIPDQVDMDGEISEAEDSSLSLDQSIPAHELLDVRACKNRAELAHKGGMAQRNKPSPDALRTSILRQSVESDEAVVVRESSESREETPDSDSGYNGAGNNNKANAMFNELRMRHNNEAESTYVNVSQPAAPVPNRDQKPPHASRQVIASMGSPPYPKGGVAMFGPQSPLGSPNGAGNQSLADQLKSRLEERRRSKEGVEEGGAMVPESIAQDIEQAVKIANETGESFTRVFLLRDDFYPFLCFVFSTQCAK